MEQVAAALELNEDAVKQRLSRGRKLLHEEVLTFVESALERTNPGKAFTIAVLAALPVLTISAKAATLGAAAAKGTGSAKAAVATGVLGALLTPLLIVFGNYFGYRMSLDSAHTEEERGHIKALFPEKYSLRWWSILFWLPLPDRLVVPQRKQPLPVVQFAVRGSGGDLCRGFLLLRAGDDRRAAKISLRNPGKGICGRFSKTGLGVSQPGQFPGIAADSRSARRPF